MKVLIITSTTRAQSGWGRHSAAIKNELERQGVSVTYFSEDAVPSGSTNAFTLSPLRGPLLILSFIRNVYMVRKVAARADVVHAFDGRSYGVYGWGAVLGRKTPLFINGVGTYSIAPLYTRGKGWLLRRAYARAKKIFCISAFTQTQLVAAGIAPDKTTVVHFGVPQFTLPSEQDQRVYASKFDISPEAYPVVLTVGAIKSRKGQLDTLQAVESLRQKFPRILYVMAGKGNTPGYVARITAYAAERGFQDQIRILSGVDDSELAYLYSRATVFALNSITDLSSHHFEGFGAVILEAGGFGVPAVGSKDSGIEDAIEDGVSGLLTNQGDPNDIATKIEQVLERYEYLAENAKKRCADFSWQKTVSAYVDEYTKAL